MMPNTIHRDLTNFNISGIKELEILAVVYCVHQILISQQ